jgi:hypothetical protein
MASFGVAAATLMCISTTLTTALSQLPYADVIVWHALHLWAFLFLRLTFSSSLSYRQYIWWWVLTLLHGMAHWMHPSFHGLTPNEHYNPLPDFIVHGLQCLLIPSNFGYLLAVSTWSAGFIGMMHKPFLKEVAWRVMSIGGVIGTQHHMLLLPHDRSVMYASFIIWYGPYLGYLYDPFIPLWNDLMNTCGLFQYWYLAWFLACVDP